MRKGLAAALALLCSAVGLAGNAEAGDRFVLRTSPSAVNAVCEAHHLRLIRGLGQANLFLVEGPDGTPSGPLEEEVAADPAVEAFEEDDEAEAPEVRADPSLSQSGTAVQGGLDRTPLEFYSGFPWAAYVHQPAAAIVGADRVWGDDGRTGGNAKVAVIDTGVDPDHPLLKPWLIDAYDFTRDIPGASEWIDLPQSTAAILDQSTAAILDDSATTVILNQSTAAILDNQTATDLAEEAPLPAAFGHGTMVAGLIRLVAPETKIMPLKAFRADGSSTTSAIVRAIYYAVEKGADVINMSFSLAQPSEELERAILHATQRGVICVAAAGNGGQETLAYPAALSSVIGVASTTLQDARAPFSNFGAALVKVSAPGEDLLTPYPGGRYALVSGTSFSAALVSGAAAVLVSVKPEVNHETADRAFRSSWFISPELGYGRLDVFEALMSLPY